MHLALSASSPFQLSLRPSPLLLSTSPLRKLVQSAPRQNRAQGRMILFRFRLLLPLLSPAFPPLPRICSCTNSHIPPKRGHEVLLKVLILYVFSTFLSEVP